jgi:hypothetical protein
MKKLVLFLHVVSFTFSFSQQSSQEIDSRTNVVGDLNAYASGLWVKPPSENNVKGSPYLFKNWSNIATIYSSQGNMFQVRNINYDTKKDRFVAKFSIDSVYVFDSYFLNKIRIYNRIFILTNNKDETSYYELIAGAKGKQILKKSYKKIKKGARDPFTNLLTQSQYILIEKYYLNSKEGLKEIKLKKKSFLKLFKQDSHVAKKIISQNNLSIKKDSDLVKFFEIYKSTSSNNK